MLLAESLPLYCLRKIKATPVNQPSKLKRKGQQESHRQQVGARWVWLGTLAFYVGGRHHNYWRKCATPPPLYVAVFGT